MSNLILQLDSQGQPYKWIHWTDAIVYHSKNMVSWSLGETCFTARGGNNKFTGEQSIIQTASIIAIKGENKSYKKKPKIPSLNNRELFRRDRQMCAYCGGIFSENKLSRDHIFPKSKGGANTWMNVVTCCSKCNQKKDDKTLEESGMQLLYVPYVPNRAERLILANRHILADQMDFLLSFVPKDSRVRSEVETRLDVH